ncbi:sigma-54-dependent transcriptional regulator [Nannocystis pusilla]|uniref:sigma-54-dependent transcriptional regulator n=1 Tax=Nannocystis pusilla TaxID=889268 RepID=UPI003B7998DE
MTAALARRPPRVARRAPDESTVDPTATQRGPRATEVGALTTLALALIWSHDEPERVGEVFVLPPDARGLAFTVGRSAEPDPDGAVPLSLRRLRPHASEVRGPFESGRVSRRQLRIVPGGPDEITVELVGRGTLAINGHPSQRALCRPGDIIEVSDRFMLLLTRRPLDWPGGPAWAQDFAFGTADRHGIVGESPAAWSMRTQLAFLAARDEHVLVVGPSGSGKELAVQAIHAASRRTGRPLIARNAATIPETLIDAELFGNLKNYPNPGTPDRPGLLGEADESSLFLDEIGELSHDLQARLLRVMDRGEYQRLGEARTRTTRLRMLAATNREPALLKHDVLARFPHRLRVPGFGERREDIALIARHLLRVSATADAQHIEQFFADDEPRLCSRFVLALTRHEYTTETRELRELLWRAVAASPASHLITPPGLVTPPAPPPRPPTPIHASCRATRSCTCWRAAAACASGPGASSASAAAISSSAS